MVRVRITVSGEDIADDIEDAIADGVDNAAGRINDQMRHVAKEKIRSRNAVFTRELLEGFVNAKVDFGNSTTASLRNLSSHAPAQEYGVSGTQKTRDTPYRYTTKKPPLEDLIPWVVENLHGSFWPDELGDPPDDFFDGGASSSVSGSSTDK